MKKLHTKKRINNKKGISMVLAIALVAVLFLTTTSFLSIAMLQQSETGTTLNSRQAYVSSKSALDMAQEFLNDGKLTLPSASGASLYYVFYYDSTGNVHKQQFTSVADANTWMKNNSGFTIIGDAYVKVIKNPDGSYTMTAVGKEDKYNDTNGGNTGDISVKFDVNYSLSVKETEKVLTMDQKIISNPPTTSGNKFFMLGDQASYTLLRSITGDQYRTIGNSHIDSDGSFVYMPKNEANSLPITTNFPLVFNYCVDFLSESNTRSKLTAYNNGIYLLGKYSGEKANGFKDLCFVTNTGTYGATLECKYLVIGGNIACKSTSGNRGITLKYSGDEPTNPNDRGIVIYFPEDSLFTVFGDNGNVINKSENCDLGRRFSAGYYWVNIPNDNGVDLATASLTPINTSNPHYTALNGIDMYSSMLENGSLKNMHSAYEDKLTNAVSILYDNGEFNTAPNNSKVFSASQITTYNNNWDDYYTYCAPSKMPSTNGYYEMYAGKEFNYLWYNIKPMTVKSGAKMSIRSNEIVLSIGPDTGEKVYKIKYQSHETYANQSNLPSGGGYTIVGTYTSAGTNKIIQENDYASFSVKPYWNESSFILKVMNDFVVERADGTTYNVKAGNYTDIPSSGLNLFSDAAKAYFESHTVTTEESHSSSVNWVMGNTINTAVADDKLDQGGKAIKFEASNGGTLKNGTYKASAIYCDFGNTVYGNGATLQADVVSIGADRIESNDGKGLFINTYSAYDESKCVLDGSTQVDGSMLQVTSDTDLKLDDGLELTLKAGYYYFPHISGSFNILSSTFWQGWTSTNPYYYTTQLNAPTVYGKETEVIKIAQIVDFEGKYF